MKKSFSLLNKCEIMEKLIEEFSMLDLLASRMSEPTAAAYAEARKELSDKDIGKLMHIVKNKGIDGVLEAQDTEVNDIS